MSEAEVAAREQKIDQLAELMYRHLQQLPAARRRQRLEAIMRIAERVKAAD